MTGLLNTWRAATIGIPTGGAELGNRTDAGYDAIELGTASHMNVTRDATTTATTRITPM